MATSMAQPHSVLSNQWKSKIFNLLIIAIAICFIHQVDCDPQSRLSDAVKLNSTSELSNDRPGHQQQQHGVLFDVWNSLTQTAKAASCPGECIHAITSIFCERVLEDLTACGQDQLRCCVSQEMYHNLTLMAEAEENRTSTAIATIVSSVSKSTPSSSWLTPSNPTSRPTTTSSTTTTTTTMAPTTQLPQEECNGTCFTPLFSILCEDPDDTKYCANGGTCCVVREPVTTPAPPASCDGNCIPVFFSGAFCNRPAELIPKTADCMPGTICCAEKKGSGSDSDAGDDVDAHNDANGDGEEEVPLNHPPPQINRPVPKPLSPPPYSMFGPHQRPFPTYPIHSYPQTGSYSPIRQTRPMEVAYGPQMTGREPVRKPSFSVPQKPVFHGPQQQHMQKFHQHPQPVPHNSLMTNEPVGGQSAPPPTVVDPPPSCNGVCITPLLKFTCFGSNVLYQNFACQSPEEVCCAPVSEVQAYEAKLLKNMIPAHFLDTKHSFHPSVVPNFIATQGQALGPHLQQHHGQHPHQNSAPHLPVPIPRPQQPSQHPIPKPQLHSGLQHSVRPSVNIAINKHILQSIPQQAVSPIKQASGVQAPIPSQLPAPAAGHTLIEPGRNNVATVMQKVSPSVSSSPASSSTPALVIHQTQNLPPTESTLSLNASFPASITDMPHIHVVNGGSVSGLSYSNTTLASIASIITSITTSSPLPSSIFSADPETAFTTAPSSIRRTSPLTCGVKGKDRPETPRVVGGRDALPGEWCWQVALVNAQNQYLCGGALIGTQWVLTAAHCIASVVRHSEEIFIRVGDHDLQNPKASPNAQSVKVSTTYVHHNHNPQTLDNDIALLKMETPVDVNESICLVCLPTRGSSMKSGKLCHVSGYGYTSEVGPMSLKVRSAKVPIVEEHECTSKINTVTEKVFILPASSFCAGGSDGSDACQGDGGGPLVCETDGFYEITGLVSWGFGCGRPDVPAVYVKVSSFIGWINQIISVNNQ